MRGLRRGVGSTRRTASGQGGEQDDRQPAEHLHPPPGGAPPGRRDDRWRAQDPARSIAPGAGRAQPKSLCP
jgi:hypothetical protein